MSAVFDGSVGDDQRGVAHGRRARLIAARDRLGFGAIDGTWLARARVEAGVFLAVAEEIEDAVLGRPQLDGGRYDAAFGEGGEHGPQRHDVGIGDPSRVGARDTGAADLRERDDGEEGARDRPYGELQQRDQGDPAVGEIE